MKNSFAPSPVDNADGGFRIDTDIIFGIQGGLWTVLVLTGDLLFVATSPKDAFF
jgi:hypothetical protein